MSGLLPRSTTERGYGRNHRRARRDLEATLPAPCGYCGRPIVPGVRWVAAHRIDGNPDAGWMVAHPDCNERAKHRRWRSAKRAPVPHPGLVVR